MMMNARHLFIASALWLLAVVSNTTQAALITPAGASGTGTYTNQPGLIIDGVVPGEGSSWTGSTNVYWNGTAVSLTVDLGDVYLLEDILVSIDNNDSYRVDYSVDGSTWSSLFTILSGYGEVGGGMDTMSTESGHGEYVPYIDFAAVSTRFLKIVSTGGDNMYSVGELQAFGEALAVPAPAGLALLLVGLPLLVRRTRIRT